MNQGIYDLADQLRTAADRIDADEPLERTQLEACVQLAAAHGDLGQEEAACGKAPWMRWRGALAAAAAVAVATALWFAVPEPTSGIEVGGAHLSLRSEVVRGGPPAQRFASGEEVYVHFELGGAAAVSLALLDARGELELVLDRPQALVRGPQRIGPFELDESTGPETVFIITAPVDTRADAFDEAIDAARARRTSWTDHESAARAIVRSVEARSTLRASAVRFEHVEAK